MLVSWIHVTRCHHDCHILMYPHMYVDDENALLGGGSLAIVNEVSGLTPHSSSGVGMLDVHEDGSMSDDFTVETHFPHQHQDAPPSPSQTSARLTTSTMGATSSPTAFKLNDHATPMEE